MAAVWIVSLVGVTLNLMVTTIGIMSMMMMMWGREQMVSLIRVTLVVMTIGMISMMVIMMRMMRRRWRRGGADEVLR